MDDVWNGDICVSMELWKQNLNTINSEVAIQWSDRTEYIHNMNRNEVATTHTTSAGRFERYHQAGLQWSLVHSSIRQYMGSWQLHTCILFAATLDQLIAQVLSLLSIMVASMVALRPWSTPRWMEMATLMLCGDTGPKQLLDTLHVECADKEHSV